MGVVECCVVVLFVDQVDDCWGEGMVRCEGIDCRDVGFELAVEQFKVCDLTAEKVGYRKVCGLLGWLDKCCMKKLVLNGIDIKVVDSLLGKQTLITFLFSSKVSINS